MKKFEAIKKLESLIEEAKPLLKIRSNSQSFIKWKRKSEIAIEQIFGKNTRHYQEFEDISYSLFTFSTNTPDSDFEGAYQKGLLTAISILESFIEEINEYWDEEITQKKENKLMKNQENQLTPPDKVTIPWLIKYIPIKLWIGSITFIVGVYILGVKSSQYSIVQEIFNLKEKTTKQDYKRNKENTIQKSNYTKEMRSLSIKLFTMKNPNTMRVELDEALKKYNKRVMPYILLYDYYIKLNDKKSALIILNQLIEKAIPSTLEEYVNLVKLLYENHLKPDLQKKYIKQAYINRDNNIQYKKDIEELYNKIIMN